ncbi:MAG: hypothetical protein EPO65_03980 [Dehalococcoidia bacterium]|nr:MAG: hypothetical protein EPO65_03980 [Dehalococcoidia bacterium]
MPEPREYGAPPQITPKGLADYLEAMSKSVMQAGMSWTVVKNKWPGMREAFLEFDPERLLAMSDREVEALLMDPRIIRNRAKVNAILHNASRMLELTKEHGTFRKYLRSKPDYWDRAKMLGKDFKFMGDMGSFHFLYVVKEQVPSYDEWRAVIKPKRAPTPTRAKLGTLRVPGVRGTATTAARRTRS